MNPLSDRRVDQAAAGAVAAAYAGARTFHSPAARRALATELHGQHSVYWTTGHMAEPKAVLLDPALLRRSRRSLP